MNKFFGIFFFLLTLSVYSFAQSQTIKGVVVDSLGKPLKGVSVFAKGNKKGTQTNIEGKFSISVKQEGNVDLIFSSTGYKSAIVTANGNKDITVELQVEVVAMDEVVVNVGYGTLKKREVSSSVSSITAKDIKDVPINNAAEALTGRLAGVQVTTSEGAPDADVKIKIRGGGSITQSNDPIYIVDGVQTENGLSTISPQDIQSIDVLKDAAATAIYGSRGANGVIIVTTKSGKQGKLSINFNTSIGIKKLANELNVLDPYEFVMWEYERSIRGDSSDFSSFKNKYGSSWDTLSAYKNARVVDWQKEVMGRTGVVANNSISISGGNNGITFTAGYTNNYEKAIVQNSNYKRNLFNLKIDYKPSKNIKVGVSGRYINQNVEGAGVSDDKGAAYNRLRNAVKYRPYVSGDFTDLQEELGGDDPGSGNGLNLTNPIRLNNNEFRKKTTNSYNISSYISYNINKRLTFKTTVGYENSKIADKYFGDTLTYRSRQDGGGTPIVLKDTSIKTQLTNSNVLSYKLNNYKKKHDFDIVLGEEIVITKSEFHENQWSEFPRYTPAKDAIEHTYIGEYIGGYPKIKKAEATLLSFFSRVNYTFNKKYILSVNFRTDGSSKFQSGSQWGYFPSASFAWRIAKEKFMDNIKAISDLKLRLSYGTVGNNRIADYLFLPIFNSYTYYYGLNGQQQNGTTPGFLPNALLKWETTISKNIGLDVSFFNDRLSITADYYENKTKDLLLDADIDPTFGYNTQQQNIGSTLNKGFEVQLSAIIAKSKNFSWNASLNIASNNNKIISLGTGQKAKQAASGWSVSKSNDFIAQVGESVGSMYGYVTDGFYKIEDFNYNPSTQIYTLKDGIVNSSLVLGNPQPGTLKLKDLNGDSIINADHDRQVIGNATPKFTGGLNQQFTYKNWDMSIFLNFVVGNKILNANRIEFSNGYTPNSNLLAIMKDRWRSVNSQGQLVKDPAELSAMNANAKLWIPPNTGGFELHSWAIEDGSFLRINNLSIGYNFSASKIQKLKVKKLRVYITANNLAVFTKYSGYDPEVNVKKNNPLTPGVDYSAYPRSRLYMFGLNATF